MAGVAVLVYDGDCGFCTTSARWLARRAAGGLDVVPWQRADLAALGLAEEQCRQAAQLVEPDGVRSAGAAVAGALRRCRPPYSAVGALLGYRPLRPAVEYGYRLVAAHRHRLPGGTPACATSAL